GPCGHRVPHAHRDRDERRARDSRGPRTDVEQQVDPAARRRLRRGGAGNASPAAAHLHLLRAAEHRHPLAANALRLHRPYLQLYRLYERGLSRRHQRGRAGPMAGSRGARHDRFAGLSPHHPAAGGAHRHPVAGQLFHLALQGYRAVLGGRRPGAALQGSDHIGPVVPVLHDLHPDGHPLFLRRLSGRHLRPLARARLEARLQSAQAQMIELVDIHKSFGPLEVLRGVSLSVAAGEVVCIIGPSGSGKSTLLRCINHLEAPERGAIRIAGRPVYYDIVDGVRGAHPKHKIAEVRARLGMVFQSFNLFPHLTALENIIEAPVHVRRMSREAATAKALQLMRRVGLEDKADYYPEEMSGGQQQRTAIARALAMDPTAMLLDNPTSGLDPELVHEVLEVMRQLRSDGMTMIIVTHEMNFARQVANRVLFMDHGAIVEEDTPARLFESPREPRTRAFLKNVLDR